MARHTWFALGLIPTAGFSLAACDARVRLVDPAASTAEPTVLTLVAADTALGQRAGWTPGIPWTEVFVRRDEDPTVLSLTADSQGVLSLPGLPAADYWVWAERHPGGAELAAPVLAPPALGGGRRGGIGSGAQRALELRGQDDASLVISEFSYALLPVSVFGDGVNYSFHWYIELYNNSDTTIYLDGKIVGAAFNYDLDAPLWPCSETAALRNEPRGVWAQRFQAFPGSGHDYPLAPGRTAVIAEQAIDHGTVYPGLPDLSNADFQFYWPTRALNPAVPTMLPIQLSTGALQTMFYLGPEAPFVAGPVDIGSLERTHAKYQGDFVLFPRTVILDLAVLYKTSSAGPPSVAALCETLVDPSLDALGAFVRPSSNQSDDYLLSAQRTLLPDGRHLQRTGTSAADWIIGPRSPGQVP